MAIELEPQLLSADAISERIFDYFPNRYPYSIGMTRIRELVDPKVETAKYCGFIETSTIHIILDKVRPYTRPPRQPARETTLSSEDPTQVGRNSRWKIVRSAATALPLLSRVLS